MTVTQTTVRAKGKAPIFWVEVGAVSDWAGSKDTHLAMAKGAWAFLKDKPTNPYHIHTVYGEFWQRGWMLAKKAAAA